MDATVYVFRSSVSGTRCALNRDDATMYVAF